ncbi:MAG: hypothetical protein AAGC60_03475 [Acidobacteriota bacterium]
MPRLSILFFLAAALVLSPTAFAEGVSSDEAAPPCSDQTVSVAALEHAEGVLDDLLTPSWAEPIPMGFFGPHCSGPPSPWTCGMTAPGLGCPAGGFCTYSCECDRCTMSDGRVETLQINCTLVDSGGCQACLQ